MGTITVIAVICASVIGLALGLAGVRPPWSPITDRIAARRRRNRS